jgi:RHS repeat-associated protein
MIEGNPTDSTFTFQGEQTDPESGLTYLRARSYDPTTGRFTSRDPLSGSVENPGTQNGYNYANNDPVNLSDPSGQNAVTDFAMNLSGISGYQNDIANCQWGSLALRATWDIGTTAFGVKEFAIGGKAIFLGAKALKVVEAERAATAVEEVVVHGNSLKSLRPTWGYKLFHNSGEFLKNGITSAPKSESRYTKAFMEDKYMERNLFPDRTSAYQWEFEQNQILRGPLNKNMH